MYSIYSIKSKFQGLLRPLVHFLNKRGVTPNQVTLATLFMSIVFGLLCYVQLKFIWFYPIVFLMRMALNAIDGMLAKEFNKQSNLGLYLNEMSDIASDFFLYLPFTLLIPGSLVVWVFIFLSLLSEVAGLLAPHIQVIRRYDGPMGKSDRAFVLSLLAVLLYYKGMPLIALKLVFAGLSGLLILTIYNRIHRALRE